MSIEHTDNMVGTDISMRTLAEIMVRQFNLHTGRYQVAINFQIGVGRFAGGPPESKSILGGMIGVAGFKLEAVPDNIDGDDIVDAAAVNPDNKPKTARKKRSVEA